MKQIRCDKGCAKKGYWIEISAETGEPVFCFRTRHNGENHAVRMTLGQIVVAAMPKILEGEPDDFEIKASYLC